MPELPDIELYRTSLLRFVGGQMIEGIQIKSPFFLRTFDPDLMDCVGCHIIDIQRLGKRIAWVLDNDVCLVFHLMIAGRFHWKSKPVLPRSKNDLAAFRFGDQTLMVTEASMKKRASLHVVESSSRLESHRPAGIEILSMTLDEFRQQLTQRNHTVKRALTDPRLFSGIGNAYSDEILHHAQLSPVIWTSRLSDSQIRLLWESIQLVMKEWIDRLQEQTGDRFPEKVTAFRPEMMVHGKYGEPCGECETIVQRIRYSDRETNYCPRCQTGGKLLADRSLSRLLKDDWPKTIDQWEENA